MDQSLGVGYPEGDMAIVVREVDRPAGGGRCICREDIIDRVGRGLRGSQARAMGVDTLGNDALGGGMRLDGVDIPG